MEEQEVWGLGVLGLSRDEFYSCSFIELEKRIKGYLLRNEIENVGIRKVITIIHNGFSTLGGGRQVSENKLWPMSFDKKFNKLIPKSEDIVKNERDFILKFWPDAKI